MMIKKISMDKELTLLPLFARKKAEKDMVSFYENKIRDLEEHISSLRLSRKVLITLLETREEEFRLERHRLMLDNKRLKDANNRYSSAIWDKNIQICRLEKAIKSLPDDCLK